MIELLLPVVRNPPFMHNVLLHAALLVLLTIGVAVAFLYRH